MKRGNVIIILESEKLFDLHQAVAETLAQWAVQEVD